MRARRLRDPKPLDVIIAGAGPAGSVAAWLLARAGVRVLLIDRETFPRDKLCGDTINPGCIAFLASLGLTGDVLLRASPLAGMLVRGPSYALRTDYPAQVRGLAIKRTEFDLWLLERAMSAGARFESGLVARSLVRASESPAHTTRGIVVSQRQSPDEMSELLARVVIAADGGQSTLARAAGLAARSPYRRWAFGAYARGIEGLTDAGEMHVRSSGYLGIAPFDGANANVCAVTRTPPRGMRPLGVIRAAIDRDPQLRSRFARAEFVGAPRVLGPLATERVGVGTPGLLLAGDAAGFVDPMTGDGIHLAIRGAALAARAAQFALETGDLPGAVRQLAANRDRTLGSKIRFNQALRRLSQSPAAVALASRGASLLPGLLHRAVFFAGDVHRPA